MHSPFYITTAINYTNGSPHMGHTYEIIVADCIARYARLMQRNVFFLTGSDEHGQKIADTAAAQNLQPIDLCNKYVREFQDLNRKLKVTPDFYIRTTSEQHKLTATSVWTRALAAGDIYLGRYEGWYNKREERFLSETEARSMDYKDGDVPLVKTSEPSYFFRLSKYQDRIINHIKSNPEFIFPKERQAEILNRLKEPLLDLSISRTTFDWGIPVPNNSSDTTETTEMHVMYVWFDALTNYLSAGTIWPPTIHLIGKDILFFHAVIWPAMLMSIGLELPKHIVCHGFINGPDGRKMSKSWQNVVDPVDIIGKYSSDTLRYFLLREGSFGEDFNFSESRLKSRYESELMNNLGNLVQRVLKLAEKYCDSKVPNVEDGAVAQVFDLEYVLERIRRASLSFDFQTVAAIVLELTSSLNGWLQNVAPWRSNDDVKRNNAIRTCLEGLYVLAHLYMPVIPGASEEILRRLGKPCSTLPELSWNNLTSGVELQTGDVLFPKLL